MAASVHVADILSDAPESRALKGSRGMQIAPNSNTLTEGVAWLFEALRVTDYFDERILCSHERCQCQSAHRWRAPTTTFCRHMTKS
jgi:hypothetical protein